MVSAAGLAEYAEGADAEGLARQVLERDPTHAGARAILEARLLQRGDRIALVEHYRKGAAAAADDSARARVGALLTGLLGEAGDGIGAVQAAGEVLAAEEAEARPLVSIARVCQSLGYWEIAQQALQAAGETVEVARLKERHLDEPAEALSAFRALFEEDPDNLIAADAVQRLARQSEDRGLLARAHERLSLAKAEAGEAGEAPEAGDSAAEADDTSGPARRVHATLAGHLFAAVGEAEASLASYQRAFELQPSRGKAFEGLRRIHLESGDAAALRALHEALPDSDTFALVSDLIEVGDADGAVEVLSAGDDDLIGLIWLEQAHQERADWAAVFETLRRRSEMLQDAGQKRAAETRLRALLADQLADTDDAWDYYRQLHEERPDDPDVLESLSGIAAARGEAELGLQYLEGLVRVSTDAGTSARYERRIATIHEGRGENEQARRAWIRALDHQPEDREALAGLRRLAEGEGDWRALVGALAREAALVEGADQIEIYARIAQVWEVELGEAEVAADAWRKVLEYAPDDPEALAHLTRLSEDAGDWTAFVQHAQSLSHHREGAERSALLRRIGQAYADHLHRADEALRFLDSASGGDHPDLVAARALERLRLGRGEWELVIESLRRQASALDGAGERQEAIETLLRGARIYRDTLHNREQTAVTFGQVLLLDEDCEEALQFLADHLFRAGEHVEAVKLFRRLETRADEWDFDDFDVQVEISLYYYHYALSLEALGDRAASREKLESALNLNPNHIPSLQAIGPMYVAGEQWKRAERVFRQLVQLIGGTAQAEQLAVIYSCLGEVEQALGKLDKAKKRFNKALELQPNNISALKGIAGVLNAQSEWNTLLNVFNNIIYYAQTREDVIEAYLAKGRVLDVQLKLPAKAAQHYRKALAFGPNQPRALLRLAELSLRSESWTEAGQLAARALGGPIEPGFRAQFLLVRAICHQVLGDGAAADVDLKAAMEVDNTLSEELGDITPAALAELREMVRRRACAEPG